MLRFQIEALEKAYASSWQIATLNIGRGLNIKYLPYVFTEQVVAMLSGTINFDRATEMNIAIMRALVAIKKLLIKPNDIKQQLQEIKERLGEHDAHLNRIYDAMENLLDEKVVLRKWEDRESVAFIKEKN